MQSNYIYLLQEREFIKTNEPIFKFGRTTKENLTRFYQYPKGSVLLFQMICYNCDNMEIQIKQSFKQHFKQQTDIGTEYFEGNYKDMIHVIYSILQKDEFIDKQLNQKLNWNEYMKEYYHKNSTSILEYQKQNYQKKKDILNEKVDCGCGKAYTRQHQKRHEKTKKHQDWMNII
jgi:hypothetical protein